MSVDAIMRRWHAHMRVFMQLGMLCFGCPIGSFHTVGEACGAHNLDESRIVKELQSAMRGDAGEPVEVPNRR